MSKIVAVHNAVPNSNVTYTIDWSDKFTDGISSSSWTVPSGLTQTSGFFSSSTASVRISGGAACSSYEVINIVQTSGGQSDSRSIILYYRNF